MSTVDLTEFGLTGVCIDAKNIGAMYDAQKIYETLPRIYIHLINTDAILVTRPFGDKPTMQDALRRLKKLKEEAKPLHLKSVK